MTRPLAAPFWQAPVLDRAGELPLQEQLARHLRAAVTGRMLRPGVRLPASRALAQELALSRTTVSSVYDRLAAEGFLETRRGSGTFVPMQLAPALRAPATPRLPTPSTTSAHTTGLPPPAVPAQATSPPVNEPPLSRRAQLMLDTPRTPRGLPAWPLTPGLPALDIFPRQLWARLEGRCWRHLRSSDVAYGDEAGLPALRTALADHLGAARGIACTPDQVIVTAGTQMAVYLAALALADPGQQAWVEHPGHEGTRRALMLAGITPVGIPIDTDGLDVGAGCQLAPHARLALVTPSHQFPLGAPLTLPRRLSLLAWARQANAFVLEDDYDSEFRYDGAPLPALQTLDEHGRTLYLGTLSKLLAPGLRLGYLVAPEPLVPALLAVRTAIDRHVSVPQQMVAAEFIGNGHLGAHIRRLRTVYAERRTALLDALRDEGAGRLTALGPATGLHIVALLPPGSNDRQVAAAARRHGIGASALSQYTVPGAPDYAHPGLLLGFGNTPAHQIRPAIRVLRQCLDEAGLGTEAGY